MTLDVIAAHDRLEVRTPCYTAFIDPIRLLAHIVDADGGSWGALRLLAAVDTLGGPDETVSVESIGHQRQDGYVRLTIRCGSTRWSSRTQIVDFGEDRIRTEAVVRGRGRITTVRLLGGARPPAGTLPSGAAHRTVFSPNLDHPWRIARTATESAVISVNGEGAEPGVGRWLFTPAPTCFGLSRSPDPGDRRLPEGPWLMLGLIARRRGFVDFWYDAVPGGFSLRCDYQGHTEVDAEFTTPSVLLMFGAPDPYEGIRRYRAELAACGLAPDPRPVARHWRQPIFSGWGAQCALAAEDHIPAAELSAQALYERFLDGLAAHGIVPGTIVIDDKWQESYATCRPHPERWPDLAGFIEARRAMEQRVLLWWKAWDPEGAPAAACVRDHDGRPVAIDPENSAGRALVEDAIAHMLGSEGLNADGLKIDYSGRAPSGTALCHAGPSWGFDLLHELLAVVYRVAKEVKPGSLIVTHTPDPGFADVTDMLRLNDILHLDHPDGLPPPMASAVVEQMTHRARIVRAACPHTPIDTDGWSLPGQADLRAYARAAPELGVPALYYAEAMDLEPGGIAAETWLNIADAWAVYRDRWELAMPGPRIDPRGTDG